MTPEQEEQVRRALASVPPAGPAPPEVAARLDARLEQLQAERAVGAGDAGDDAESDAGTTGEPAGRSRRWPRLLVAAAVLTVVGIGLGNLMDDFTGGQMDAMTAQDGGGEAAEEGGDPRALEGPREAEPPPAAEESYAGASSLVADRMVLTAERVALDSDRLRNDVEDFLTLRLPRAAADDEVHSERTDEAPTARRLGRLFTPCALPRTRSGDQLVAVRLDGDPATLVLREPEEGTRVAQVYSCGDPSRLLARTQVDAR